MRACCWFQVKLIGLLLVSALAFCQADQATTAQQPTGRQPTTQRPANRPPAKPQSVADAARASRQVHKAAPPAKVYRNKDVRERSDVGSPTVGSPSAATSVAQPAAPKTASEPAAQTTDQALLQNAAAFESQGKILRNEILVQKGKIVDLQNDMASLQRQFADWSTEFSPANKAPVCWTPLYNSFYYQDWCSTGRNLNAQYEASQRQLEQEKARLEQMQEDIRRKGYGNAVYDPD
jgi:hypothetical protein